MKVIIVGGVAGGASTAARLRRLDENSEIILFERGENISYANCGLPYYIGGVISDKEDLFIQTPESFFLRYRVQVRVCEEVISIDREKQIVEVCKLSDGSVYEECYDQLVLSPGAEPFLPALEGMCLPRVFTLRTVNDAVKIRKIVCEKKYAKAVMIGGGFIGLEVCENLREAGLDVTVVEAASQILSPYDEEMAAMVQKEMEENGIHFYLNTQASGICEKENQYKVCLKDRNAIFCDFVILSIGVRPENKLAKEAGLVINRHGNIVTDEHLRTSDKHIFALGDAAEIYNPITAGRGMIALAGPANKQGRIVADNLVGRKSIYPGAIGSSVIKIFNMTAACTGANEKTLKQMGIVYDKVYLLPMSHASYYPDATQLKMKLLFSPEGKILGAQCVGFEGVEKRMDVIATAIHFGGTVYDLTELDLCYAPPYSSAKDPVNYAGYTAMNVLDGMVKMWHWDDLSTMDYQKAVVLDVRNQDEWEEGHLFNARLIPVDELRGRLDELPKNKEIFVYCQVGIRGYIACRILVQNGYRARNLSGGYGLLKNIGREEYAKSEID